MADGASCKVIHTPGHTAGHCSFIEENTKIAFLADIDLTRFVFYGGIDSSLLEYEKSMEKIGSMEIKTVVTSHLGVVEEKDIAMKLEEHQIVIKKRDDRILSNFSENHPIKFEDLLYKNLIYKRYDDYEKEYQYVAERIMIKNHIEKFLVENLIVEAEGGYTLY
jgi:glyoxylase-like metal-dependent hydrolase (beta-lactamase superfamily II)